MTAGREPGRFLKAAWYMAARSAEVNDQLLYRRICGQPALIYEGASA